MLSPVKPHNSVYAQYVFTNLPLCLAQGQGCYDVHGLASLIGLHVTHNFRKRVKQLVQTGVLTEYTVFNARGGLTAVFGLPEAKCEEGVNN